MLALRSRCTKVKGQHTYRSLEGSAGADGKPAPCKELNCGLELFHLDSDIGESTDRAAANPDVVEKLKKLADKIRTELGDGLTKVSGTELRPAGKLE